MIGIGILVAVYLAFAAKHLIADYYLQTVWMVHGKASVERWVLPLSAHAGMHAAGTLIIVILVRPSLWWLAPLDFVVHAAIDRGKGIVVRHLDLSTQDTGFWWAIGTDQALHQLTHFAYVIALVAS